MTVSLDAISPEKIMASGGHYLELSGTFTLGEGYYVHIGPNGDDTDPQCHSGVAGQGFVVYPQSETLLVCYSPLLDPSDSPVDVYVESLVSGNDLLASALEVVHQHHEHGTFSIRSVFPPHLKLGTKDIRFLPEIGNLEYDEKGFFEAWSSVIGESNNEIGGNYKTRLLTAATAGQTTINVETTFNWDESGKIGIDGIVYHYTGKTDTTFTGISYLDKGASASGLKIDHRIQAPVLDLNKSRTALDLVRRAMLVDYAEDEYLTAIGNNYGVDRLPFLSSDDQYREVIKAIAHNPRGTIYGLELALDALAGAGNYEIYEDLINFPNTVFIRLNLDITIDENFIGETFLTGEVPLQAASSTTVDLGGSPLSVGSVQLSDTDVFTDTRVQKPSAQTIEDYEGDAGTQIWTYQGDDESIDVSVLAAGYTQIQSGTVSDMATYFRYSRIQNESDTQIEMLFMIPSSFTFTGNGQECCIGFMDETKSISCGCFPKDASNYYIDFIDFSGNSLDALDTELTYDQWHTIRLVKNGTNDVELWVDGYLVKTLSYAAFSAMLWMGFTFFGQTNNSPNAIINIKQIAFKSITQTDYLNLVEDGDFNSANPTRLVQSVGSSFESGDVGKTLFVSGSTITNSQNGNNNGEYEIENYISASIVELKAKTNGTINLSTSDPDRIIASDSRAFKFPDDLGKKIVISDSESGNNGEYIIDKLLDPDDLADLESYDTWLEQSTNVCEVVSGGFVTESDLPWAMYPVFATESNVEYMLVGAYSEAGGIITLRETLPTFFSTTTVVDVKWSQFYTAQIITSNDVNDLISEPPAIYKYYPAYIGNPLGRIVAYLDNLTAAGVIPEVELF